METTNSFTFSSERRDVTRLIKKILLFCPIFIGVAVVNVSMDPACLYKNKSYEEGMASILSKGMNVGRFGNCDERLVQKYLIEKNSSPEIIILGSSRSMEIGRNVFPNQSISNNTVSGAQLLDYVGLYSVYKKNHHTPKLVVLETSPWLFNSNGDNRWESITDDIVPMLREIGFYPKRIRVPIISGKWWNVLSPSYFQAAVSKPQAKETVKYFETDAKELDAFSVKRSDGTIAYDKQYRGKTAIEVRKEAVEYATNKDVYALAGYTRIDMDLVKFTEIFVKKIQNDGSKVVFFIPPYHPETFQRLIARTDTRIILEAEAEMFKLARKMGVQVIGGSDPAKYGLKEVEFYDGMHPRGAALQKIFKGVRADNLFAS